MARADERTMAGVHKVEMIKSVLLLFAFCLSSRLFTVEAKENKPLILNISSSWTFHTGDDVNWTKPDFEGDWDDFLCNHVWEVQGFENYDGCAWYRLKIEIPSELENDSFPGSSLRVAVGEQSGSPTGI